MKIKLLQKIENLISSKKEKESEYFFEQADNTSSNTKEKRETQTKLM